MRFLRSAAASISLLAAAVPHAKIFAQSASFPFERIAQERGLSNGTVTAIAQGRHGFLWFGTQDGLNMYDGTGFTIYRPVPGDTTTLSEAWITSVAPAADGSIWVGTLHGGVQHLVATHDRVQRFQHDSRRATSLASDEVSAVIAARNGKIWVGTKLGLDGLDPATGIARHYIPATSGDSAEFSNDVISLAEFADGSLWVGTRRNVYLFDRTSGRFEQLHLGLRTREIRAMLLDAHGTVWLGTLTDLVAVDGRTHRVLQRYTTAAATDGTPIAGGVNALAEGPDGTIWIGGENGVVELDSGTGRFIRHTRDLADRRSLGGPRVRSLLVDNGGVLWVGLESYGLSKHAPAAVTFDLLRHDPSAAQSLSDGYVRGIVQDARGDLWIGTQNGGLDRVDGHTQKIRVYRHDPANPRSLPGDNVWVYFQDHTGKSWVGLHETGFGSFDPATGDFTRSPLVPFDVSVNVIYEDREGRLYVGAEGRGLYEISADRKHVETYGYTMGDHRTLVDNDVESVLEDRDGMLWVGGAGGLTRLDRATGQATNFRGLLGAAFVTNVVQDSRGNIWVATKGGGVERYDAGTGHFTIYSVAQGLPHSFVYGVLEDAHHKLWLSTDDGIAMFDPASGQVTRYGLEDGLQAREFNRRAHYRAPDGTMYFGGINGVNVFRPDALAEMPAPPAVSFVALKSGSVRRSAIALTKDSVVHLAHDSSSFTISFAALDYTAPEKIRYAYKLEGVDADWVMAGDRHEATYASVPAGEHLFRVIAASPAGEWNRTGAAVTFVVTPAWWATWWARTLEALAVVGIVLAGIQLRERSTQRRRADLERRVEEQTRDLTEAHARLRESLEREREGARELIELTAAVPGAVFQLREGPDREREFVFVSEGAARLFPAEDMSLAVGLTGDPWRAVELVLKRLHPEDRSLFEETLAASRATLDTWHVELRWKPSNDSEMRWLAIQAHAARHSDGATVWTGVMTDATAARQAEAERVDLEMKMQQAQKAESLAVLAGGVAHDFNNVLVSVVVGAELLDYQVGDNPKAKETVKRIRNAGFRASELTQQMLAYAGKGRLSIERVNMSTLVEEMLSLVRTTVPRTIELDYHACSITPIVEADATQLRQIVMNLVTNASEAIGDQIGRVKVRVEIDQTPSRELTLTHAAPDMPADGPFVVFEVQDNGCGMDAALLERIFDPFFSTKFTGRGLGLAALLGIVRAHHGGLNVTSEPGRGTRFQIYLPLVEGIEPATVANDGGETAMASGAVRVLIADDELDVREIAQAVLQELGYEVVLAADGAEAVAATEVCDIDVFLLDVTMPKLNGAAAARALRAKGISVPIVLMSGYAEEDLLTRGLTIDADAFLKKPFLASDLGKVLHEVMRRAPSVESGVALELHASSPRPSGM